MARYGNDIQQQMMANQLSAIGSGFGGSIGQAQGLGGFSQGMGNPFADRDNRSLSELLKPIQKPKPKTIRQELQSEVDEWLKDIK